MMSCHDVSVKLIANESTAGTFCFSFPLSSFSSRACNSYWRIHEGFVGFGRTPLRPDPGVVAENYARTNGCIRVVQLLFFVFGEMPFIYIIYNLIK